MRLTVIIPTYKRPVDLERCLGGLAAQDRQPDQVLIVIRTDDDSSPPVVSRWTPTLPLQTCSIDRPGVVQALNLALGQVDGDIVTVTDDDSLATPDWLARIERHFEQDPQLGGLGGRDILHERGKIIGATTDKVGLILPYGRIIGNHHLGLGPARPVDHLKGVNMSWRMTAIEGKRFDTTLRGKGAQVYFELAFGLDVAQRGWRIVYDPEVLVHHYLALRFDNDVRGNPDVLADENAAYNLCVALRRYMRKGVRRGMALLWMRLIGSFGHPGLLRGFWYRITRNSRGIELSTAVSRAWRDASVACAGEKA